MTTRPERAGAGLDMETDTLVDLHACSHVRTECRGGLSDIRGSVGQGKRDSHVQLSHAAVQLPSETGGGYGPSCSEGRMTKPVAATWLVAPRKQCT
jgi:hypothetical protein